MARLRWLRLYARALGVWRVLQALRSASAATYDAGEEKKQPTADATDVLDTAERIRRTAQQEAALGMRASVQQSVEQQDVERSGDVSAAARPTAAGAEKPARESHRARTEAPAFLDYKAYVQTEVVKKAMLVVQKPIDSPEEHQEQELGGAEDSRAAGGSPDHAQSLPAPAVIQMLAQVRWMRAISRALGMQSVLKALRLASAATFHIGEEKQPPTAAATGVLDTAQRIPGDSQDRAALGMRASSQQTVEQQQVEHGGNASSARTPAAAGAESHAHETLRPSADEPVFLNAADYTHAGTLKKAVLMVQEPFEKPKEPLEQEGSKEEARAGRGGEPGMCPTQPHSA